MNDGSVNNWTVQVAQRYGLTLASSAAGGQSYAQGNARITAKPDAAGNASTPTVSDQVDTFLTTQTVLPGDMVLVSAGTADLIVGMMAVQAGTQTADQYLAQVRQAGADLATQVRRLANAKAEVVILFGSNANLAAAQKAADRIGYQAKHPDATY